MRPWFKNVSAIRKWFIRTFLMVVLWAPCVSVSAELGDRAAIIETINGSSNLFKVKRGKEKLSVFPLMALRGGDKLYVLKAEDTLLKGDRQSYVILTFGGNQSVKVTYQMTYKTPYLVKKRNTTPSIVENVATDTKSWFSSLYEHFYDTVLTRIKSIEVFSIPLLTKHETQLLVAGQRVLHMAWRGGKGPYQVQVYRCWGKTDKVRVYSCRNKADKMLLNEQKTHSKRVPFEQWWIAGHYQVIIRDKSGKEIEGKFQVVKGEHPLPKQNATSTMLEWTKNAAQLAQQAKGTWRFEAYQQIFNLAEKQYQPALVLREGLEAGK
jgi:hypothetical protein